MTTDLLPPGKPRPKRRTLRWTLGILGLLLAVLVGGVGLTFWAANNALQRVTSGRGGSPVDVFVPQPLTNEDSGHVNVLLAGNSYDDPGHGGSTLTDSIMVASVNLTTHKTALISIPRDLYVDYNGNWTKINAVYVYAGGGDAGMRALGGVVERVTGLRIDQRVLVGYQAVRDLVDAVGGIDVTIGPASAGGIEDPSGTLGLAKGVNRLDGEAALKLARTRYGLAEGDFDRQRNQRIILAAIAKKATTTPALANPAAVLAIFETLSANVHTDLSAGQLRRFYDLFKGGFDSSVSIRGPAGRPLLENYTAPDGGATLVPKLGHSDHTAIRAFVAEVTGA